MSNHRTPTKPDATSSTNSPPPSTPPPSTPATAATPPPTLKYLGIVFLGMNPDAASEGSVLFQANKDRGYAKSITDAPVPDQVALGDVTYDLSTPEGIQTYASALELTPEQTDGVIQLLNDQGEDARDEVGQLCLIYAQAERGERRMERVVISGHSAGGLVWGDGNGIILFETFEALARIFPRAAGQVRDVMFSACYTGGERYIEQYRRMFPSVESIWAYAGSSPGTWSGAQVHLKIWEQTTEGTEPAALDPELAAGTRKGENVAIWTAAGGYQGGEPLTLKEAEVAVEAGEPIFQRYFFGEAEVEDPSSGPLRAYYDAVQRLLSHPDIGRDQWRRTETRRDVTLRLLFYPVVRSRFAQTYATQLEHGYGAAHIPLPDYATLSRADALAEIAAFPPPAASTAREITEARWLLEQGLRDLDPAFIPFTWI